MSESQTTAAALETIRGTVRERYGAIAQRVAEGAADASCCG